MEKLSIDISVIIPVYNRFDEVRRCVESLIMQSVKSVEILIINDCSNDGDYQVLQQLASNVHVYQNTINSGPSYSRNFGINRATGRYLLFLDSDTICSNHDLLKNMTSFFSVNQMVGSVGGEIRVYEQDFDHVYGRMIATDGTSYEMRVLSREGIKSECDFLATCCCMVPAEVARNVGGFDPYYVFGSEDKDFGYRIRLRGFANYISALCSVEHHHSPKGRNRDETYRYQLTRIRFALKYNTALSAVVIFVKNILQVLLFYALMPLKLVCYVMMSKQIRSENILGGLLLLKALIMCVTSYKSIRAAVNTDFLSEEEMDRYVCWRKSGADI